MKRIIIQPADISGAPLSDLKSWLGISRSTEDALLGSLLEASLSLCEGFTGQAPLVHTIEESFQPVAGPQQLASRPINSIISVERVEQDGTRSALSTELHEIVFDARGSGCLNLFRNVEARAVAVQATAGVALDWSSLPGPLKQGIIRMAAYLYRDRDRSSEGDRVAPPPASVAALWRPWRSLRLT